jgi:hypothetical protein
MFSKLFSTNTLSSTKDVMLLRVDYSNDEKWKRLKEEISTPDPHYGFLANITIYENTKFDNLPLEIILPKLSKKYIHPIILIADQITFNDDETTILCVDLKESPGQYLRVIPSELWGIENNLSICNMDFQDFADCQDENGVFRGF